MTTRGWDTSALARTSFGYSQYHFPVLGWSGKTNIAEAT